MFIDRSHYISLEIKINRFVFSLWYRWNYWFVNIRKKVLFSKSESILRTVQIKQGMISAEKVILIRLFLRQTFLICIFYCNFFKIMFKTIYLYRSYVLNLFSLWIYEKKRYSFFSFLYNDYFASIDIL